MTAETWKTILWHQFGAAIDMLEDAIRACPEQVWSEPGKHPEWLKNGVVGFWYLAFHTAFWLDFYLADSPGDYTPPAPFDLGETDPAGILPERAYSKTEVLDFLDKARERFRNVIDDLKEEDALRERSLERHPFSRAELLIYNLRHVQHHAAQLHLLLRQAIGETPGWVSRTRVPLDGGQS